ncbi:MAG: hypothetical protein ACLU3I_08585 [Acutalibacteraceae bacterium]
MINELTRKNAHTELDHIFKTILPCTGMTERPEQIRLSHTMLDAMFENRIALSDAGTGIGKTYAYLTAAIVYSHSRLVDGLPFQPVIIATSSIALQNAIVREYLPFLSDALSDDPHRLKQEKARLLDTDSDDLADRTRDLMDALTDGPYFLDSFDAELFDALVEKIIVDSNERLRFRLKNSLELLEQIERTRR